MHNQPSESAFVTTRPTHLAGCVYCCSSIYQQASIFGPHCKYRTEGGLSNIRTKIRSLYVASYCNVLCLYEF
jgi:hypothetical protein